MFNTNDCVIFQSILKTQPTFDITNLIAVLNRLAHASPFVITTLSELKTFILSLELKDVEIEALMLYLVQYKPAFLESFTDLDVFRQFLCDENHQPTFSFQINLRCFQSALICRVPSIIKEKTDVVAFIDLIRSLLPDDKRLELFYAFYGETIQALFKPYQLPANSHLNQPREEIYSQITQLRSCIPSVYQPDYEAIEELLGDTLYEWSKQHGEEAIGLGQQWLQLIANYEYIQRTYIHSKNQFSGIIPVSITPTERIALVDVDQTLITYNAEKKLLFNLDFILKLLRHDLKDIYLFTDMPCCSENILHRENVILFLSKQGIRVHGVLTPTDLIADLPEEDFKTVVELSFAEDPPSQLFIGHQLVQAIYQRFLNAHFPPTCGKTYKVEQEHLQKTTKPKSFLCNNLETLMSQFRRNERKPAAAIRSNLMRNVWTALRHIEAFQAQRAGREPSHIKLHVLKQFLSSHSKVQKIYVFDDQTAVLDSIDTFVEQNRDRLKTTIQTKLVKFKSVLNSTSNYSPFLYQPESAVTVPPQSSLTPAPSV